MVAVASLYLERNKKKKVNYKKKTISQVQTLFCIIYCNNYTQKFDQQFLHSTSINI